MRVNLEPEKAFIGKKFAYVFLGIIFSLNAITLIWFFFLEILLGSALSALVYPKGPYIGAPSNAQPMIGECTVGSEKSNLSLGGPSNVNLTGYPFFLKLAIALITFTWFLYTWTVET